jgi:hypothetical protein
VHACHPPLIFPTLYSCSLPDFFSYELQGTYIETISLSNGWASSHNFLGS